MEKQLVLFDLGTRNFGVEVSSVVRIGLIPETLKKPKSPRFIEGQFNHIGCTMPIVDLHRWFGINGQKRTEDSRVMVVNLNGIKVGMIVSAVTDVVYVDEKAIASPTKKMKNKNSEYVFGVTKINEQLVTLVDLCMVLTNEEKNQLKLFNCETQESF